MSSSKINIKFIDGSNFYIKPGLSKMKKGDIPRWALFEYMPCPGNQKHGADIDYCLLSLEITTLVEFFSNINSTDKGVLTIQIDKSKSLQIENDAQNIFFYAVWFLLLHSQCSVFKFNQWARSNYLPSVDPKRIYYTLLSKFLTEHYFISPNTPPDIEKFKSVVLMLHVVLKNLLKRIRDGLEIKSDSVNNGIALFDTLLVNLLHLVKTEGQHSKLAKTIKKESVLSFWV